MVMSCNPTCNLQPNSQALHGCTSKIYHATEDATDNDMNIHDKEVLVAGLQGNQGSKNELKFSPQHLAALLKEGEEIEL